MNLARGEAISQLVLQAGEKPVHWFQPWFWLLCPHFFPALAVSFPQRSCRREARQEQAQGQEKGTGQRLFVEEQSFLWSFSWETAQGPTSSSSPFQAERAAGIESRCWSARDDDDKSATAIQGSSYGTRNNNSTEIIRYTSGMASARSKRLLRWISDLLSRK